MENEEIEKKPLVEVTVESEDDVAAEETAVPSEISQTAETPVEAAGVTEVSSEASPVQEVQSEVPVDAEMEVPECPPEPRELHEDFHHLEHRSIKELKMINKIERERAKQMHKKDAANNFFLKIVIILILVLAIAGVAMFGIVYITNQKPTGTTTIHMSVESTLTSCQELVTYKYKYKQVDFIKRNNIDQKTAQRTDGVSKKSSSYVLLKYSGVLRAGIEDLTQCTFDYSEDGTTIIINTPPVVILGNEISSYDVVDEYQKTFKILSVKETMKELDKRKRELENEAIETGFLTDAAEHAKLTLEKFFLAAGFEKVEVVMPEIDINDYIVDEAFEVAEAH